MKRRPKKEPLIVTVHRELQRRHAAILAMKNGRKDHGLVPVMCGDCGGAIATTKVDRDKGEPIILYEFPENAKGWTHGGHCPDAVQVDFERYMLRLPALRGSKRRLRERIASLVGLPAEALA